MTNDSLGSVIAEIKQKQAEDRFVAQEVAEIMALMTDVLCLKPRDAGDPQ